MDQIRGLCWPARVAAALRAKMIKQLKSLYFFGRRTGFSWSVGGAVIGGGNLVHLKKQPKGYRVGNNAYAWRVSYVGQRTPTKQSRPRKQFEEFKPANSQIETHMTASRQMRSVTNPGAVKKQLLSCHSMNTGSSDAGGGFSGVAMLACTAAPAVPQDRP